METRSLANAYLIAAAPKLYEQLRLLVRWAEDQENRADSHRMLSLQHRENPHNVRAHVLRAYAG